MDRRTFLGNAALAASLLPLSGIASATTAPRGRLLPVMDLCGFFGSELSPLRKKRRVLVVDHQDVFAGLTVDEVFGMQHFPVDTFTEQLPPLEASIAPFIHGVFQREQPWLVFSPHALAQNSGFLDVAY